VVRTKAWCKAFKGRQKRRRMQNQKKAKRHRLRRKSTLCLKVSQFIESFGRNIYGRWPMHLEMQVMSCTGQDVDAHGFPIKDSFYITVASLPTKVKNIMVHVNNFGGAGMRDVKTLCTRVVDATEQDPNAHRDLFIVNLPSGKGEHSKRTVAVLAKIYKEYVGTSPHFTKFSYIFNS
jgi:hypothetical protein